MEAKASNNEIIKTGDVVLVRDGNTDNWIPMVFIYYKNNRYYTILNYSFPQCIPLKNNEHLCGTNNEFEKSYTPKFGDKVKGITHANEKICGVLVGYYDNEEMPYKNYSVAEEVYTNHGFTYKCYNCRTVKPIKE